MRPPRQRYLRTFVGWLSDQRDFIAVRLQLVENRKRCLVYRMAGYPSDLEVVVRPGEVMVVAMHGEACWDILMCFESSAVKADGGYRCSQCEAKSARWPSRQALWQGHDFDALAAWLKSQLGAAEQLELHQMGGMTWTQLVASPTQVHATTLTHRWVLPSGQAQLDREPNDQRREQTSSPI